MNRLEWMMLQPVIDRVMDAITAKPGILRIELDLLASEGYTMATVRKTTKLLILIGRVRTEPEGKERRHYPTDNGTK